MIGRRRRRLCFTGVARSIVPSTALGAIGVECEEEDDDERRERDERLCNALKTVVLRWVGCAAGLMHSRLVLSLQESAMRTRTTIGAGFIPHNPFPSLFFFSLERFWWSISWHIVVGPSKLSPRRFETNSTRGGVRSRAKIGIAAAI